VGLQLPFLKKNLDLKKKNITDPNQKVFYQLHKIINLVWFIHPVFKESKQAHPAYTLKAHAAWLSAPLSGAAPFLRTYRLG
jgi:hypothetical protein